MSTSKTPFQPVSPESDMTSSPQALPNIITIPYIKSASLLTSAPAGTSSKPPSKSPQDRDPQSQEHADTLARLGIKVRDFAYENPLPPIKPFRIRQIQPGPRPLKRTTRDEGEDDVFYQNYTSNGEGESNSMKKTRLHREVTEPVIQQTATNLPARSRGFANLDDYDIETKSQKTDGYSSQPPPEYFDSQDTDPYIDTPLVTPNGSLQWRVTDNSSIPASQLDTDPLPDLLSYAQLSQSKDHTGLSGSLTPMSSLSSIPSDPPTSPIPADKFHKTHSLSRAPKHPSPFIPSPSRSSNASPSPPNPKQPTKRYQLRQRPQPVSSHSPTKSTMRNRHHIHPTSHPASRPLAFSMQSSHLQKNSVNQPRPRTVRKRTAPG